MRIGDLVDSIWWYAKVCPFLTSFGRDASKKERDEEERES